MWSVAPRDGQGTVLPTVFYARPEPGPVETASSLRERRFKTAPKTCERNTAMQLAMHTIFAASRKEPLADVLERIHAAIIKADFGEPQVQFALADSRGVSSVDRVLKRFPSLERFTKSIQPNPAVEAVKAISNNAGPGSSAEQIDFAILLEIARGVQEGPVSQHRNSVPASRILRWNRDSCDDGPSVAATRHLGQRQVVGERTPAIRLGSNDRRRRLRCQETASSTGSNCRGVGRMRQGKKAGSGPLTSALRHSKGQLSIRQRPR